jgi:hypothetical protein
LLDSGAGGCYAFYAKEWRLAALSARQSERARWSSFLFGMIMPE